MVDGLADDSIDKYRIIYHCSQGTSSSCKRRLRFELDPLKVIWTYLATKVVPCFAGPLFGEEHIDLYDVIQYRCQGCSDMAL